MYGLPTLENVLFHSLLSLEKDILKCAKNEFQILHSPSAIVLLKEIKLQIEKELNQCFWD